MTVPVDPADIAPARQLRTEFARFWSTETGTPREVYDRFIGATPAAGDVDIHSATGSFRVSPATRGRDGTLLYLHGGGYGVGSAAAYTGFVSQLVDRTHVPALILDYPLAPEAQLPEALELAVRTVAELSVDGPVTIAGDSAGGGLSLATTAHARADGLDVAGVAVFSPWTDLTLSGATFAENAISDPLLDPAYLRASAAAYLGAAQPDDPRASPLFGDVARFPPLLIQVGTDELLLDDSRRFASTVAAAGGAVTLEVYQGMHHVFQLNLDRLATARRAVDRAAAFLSDCLAAASQ